MRRTGTLKNDQDESFGTCFANGFDNARSYADDDVDPGTTYSYDLGLVYVDGSTTTVYWVNGTDGVNGADSPYTGIQIGTDGDPPTAEPGIMVSPSSLSITEGSSDSYNIKLTKRPTGNVTVTIAEQPDDDSVKFQSSSATTTTKTFTPRNWSENQTVYLRAVHDDDTNDETVTFTNTASGGGYDGVSANVTVKTLDDDGPPVTVSFGTDIYTVNEGSRRAVTVTLSAVPQRTVNIPIETTGQGGAGDSDYSISPETVTFGRNERSKSFTFIAEDDSDDDDDESVLLSFPDTLPNNVSLGRYATSTVNIADNDFPAVAVSFDKTSATLREGETTTVTFSLTDKPERRVNIPIRRELKGGASVSDYSGMPSSVLFTSEVTEKTYEVRATDDSVDDDDESITFSFDTSLPPNVESGSISSFTLNITDDDDPRVAVRFEKSSDTVNEGDSIDVNVFLTADPEREITIPLSTTTHDGATEDDYSFFPESVTFLSGSTSTSFSFTAIQDEDDDDNNKVRFAFGELPDSRVSRVSPSQTTITIVDDDNPDVSISFGEAEYDVDEGRTITIPVTLSADPERDVEIDLVPSNQGTTTDDDYTLSTTSLRFVNGDTRETFTFTAAQDTADDDDESVLITWGTLPVDIDRGTHNETTVSINDDDGPEVNVYFDQPLYRIAEEGATSATVTVSLSEDPERRVPIQISKTNQDGASSSDYSGIPPSVTFEDGDTSKSFVVTARDDTTDDDGESVLLSFRSLPSGVSTTTGTNDEATIEIEDNDDPQVRVKFEQAAYEVDEGQQVTVNVILDADPERTVEIPLSTTTLGGAMEDDYSFNPQTITFESGGPTTKSFTFTAIQDTDDDDGNRVKFSFGDLPDRVVSNNPRETTITIIDDDNPAVSVTFASAEYDVREGGRVTIPVTLSADPEQTVEIPLIPINQDDATDDDYELSTTSLVFVSGDTRESFTFTATQDIEDDDDESVEITWGTLPPDVSNGNINLTTVNIEDDDHPQVTVRFEQATYDLDEGDTTIVRAILSEEPQRRVTVSLRRSQDSTASSSDYRGVPPRVSFASDTTTTSFVFTAVDDTSDEEEIESVQFTLAGLPTGVSTTSPDTATFNITDDDDPQVRVSFEKSSDTVEEGSSIDVKVILDKDPERTVQIPLSTTTLNGATEDDYRFTPDSVIFDSGDTSTSFMFTAEDDQENDDGERVRFDFGDLPDGVSRGSPSQTTIAIEDNDFPEIDLSFERDSYSVEEGHGVTVRVTLSANPERRIEIPLSTTTIGTITEDDYSGIPASVVFNTNDRSETFTFRATEDRMDDEGEGITVGFESPLPENVTETPHAETTVNIIDDDGPGVTLSRRTINLREGQSGDYTVVLDTQPVNGDVTVVANVEADDQDESVSLSTSSAVYSKTLTFTRDNWNTRQTVKVTALEDPDAEDEEAMITHTVSGTGEYNDILPDTLEVTVNVNDNETPGVTVRPTTLSLIEDHATESEKTYTIKLNSQPSADVTISYTKTGTGADSVSVSGPPFTFDSNNWDAPQTTTVSALSDTDGDNVAMTIEHDITTDATEYENLRVSSVRVNVADDEVPQVRVSFDTSTLQVAEGRSATIRVTLSSNPERVLEIPLSTSTVNGASEDDYSGVPDNLRFNSGQTQRSFTFRATQDRVDDDDDDDNEGVSISIGDLSSLVGVSPGTTTQVTVSITDDDTASVTLSPTSLTITEGNTRSYNVKLNTQPSHDVLFDIFENSDDIEVSTTTLTFTPSNWTSSQSVRVTALTDDDSDDESAEIYHSLFGADEYSALDSNELTLPVTITDSQTAGVRISQTSLTVDEGSSEMYSVRLTAPPSDDVTVTVNSPTDNTDVTTSPPTLTFNSNNWQTPQDVEVEAAQDDDSDNDTATVTHSVAGGGYDNVTADDVVVTVRDDDEQPGVTISRTALTISEGEDGTYTIRLDAEPTGDVTVTINDPTDNTDVTTDPATLTFSTSTWQTAQTVTVSADHDDDYDEDSATITHSVAGGGYDGVSADDVDVTVTDDDVPSVDVSFQFAMYEVVEGDDVVVRVILSENPRRTVVIPINTTNLSGASDDDYSGVPNDLTFDEGETTMSFTFSATQDILNDDDESVRLTFGDLPDDVTEGTNSAAVVSITDDDGAGVMVKPTSLTIDEGSSGQYRIFLDEQPTANVTIAITAPAGSDVSVNTGSLIFTRGNWNEPQFVTVSAAHDDDEDDDTAVILHSASGATEYAGIGISSVTVTVADDDAEETVISISRASRLIIEGTSATFTLDRSGPTTRSLQVMVNVTQSGDFVEASDLGVSSWTIPAGGSSAPVVVATIDDNVVESSGSVTARLRTGPGYMVGTPSSATIVISDNDIPVLPPENLSPTPTATATPSSEGPRGDMPTPTRIPKPTATPVPIEKVDVTQVPGATTIQPDESKELKSGGAGLKIPYTSRARTYQVIFAETDTCQDGALGSVKAWVYTAEGEREHEVWSIHPLEISFTLSKSEVENYGGLGVLFQAYAIGGVVIQGSDRLPGRWNDIRPTFFDANTDGSVTAYAMTRYFSPTFCLHADPELLERADQQVNGTFSIATATPTATVGPRPTATAVHATARQDADLPVSGDVSSSRSLVFALIAAALFLSLLVAISITDRARPRSQRVRSLSE